MKNNLNATKGSKGNLNRWKHLALCPYIFLKATRYLMPCNILVILGQGKFSFKKTQKRQIIKLKVGIFEYIPC